MTKAMKVTLLPYIGILISLDLRRFTPHFDNGMIQSHLQRILCLYYVDIYD